MADFSALNAALDALVVAKDAYAAATAKKEDADAAATAASEAATVAGTELEAADGQAEQALAVLLQAAAEVGISVPG